MTNYKFENGSLYQLHKDAMGGNVWMHVMKCSPRIKTLKAAIAAYED
jgi:hypothetical protein